MSDFLLVHKSILPDGFEKIVEARRKLSSGEAKDVSQAVKLVGISRSTFYKYKDYVFEPAELSASRRAVFSMMLSHEPGVLSTLLTLISGFGGSVLAITQSLPIRGRASVTVSLDIGALTLPFRELTEKLEQCPGVDQLRVLAVE